MNGEHLLAAASGHFTLLDWGVVVGYLAFTTILGAKLAGKQSTIHDFFLGGRKLPWFAVSGSIIATEISAVTFVGVPSIVFAANGDFTYLQLGVGTVLARIIIGYYFVPAFYARHIFSPYDYMANRLGPRVHKVITGLFIVGQLLGQGVRVYLTALVLEVVTDGRLNIHYSIWIIGFIAIAWTILGGIATVIWTDTLLFLLFVVGAIVSLGFVAHLLPGGLGEIIQAGIDGNKFRVLNFSTDLTLEFTFWTGIIASTWGSLNAYGTDQLIAQRMFCCKGPKQARIAIIASSASLFVTLMVLFVGVGLVAYYNHHPLTGADAELIAERGDRIFPIFIVRVLPAGLTGLIVAGIFAAAISSLDSILAALSQTFLTAFYRPFRKRHGAGEVQSGPSDGVQDQKEVLISRVMVVIWGVALCGMAYVSIAATQYYKEVLNLALSMVGYTGGAMLAGFLLALWRINVNDRGLVWSAPISLIAVFGLAWKEPWATYVIWGVCALLLVMWLLSSCREVSRFVRKTPLFLSAIAIVLILHHYLGFDRGGDYPSPIAYPWFIPIGSVIAFVFGILLADRRDANFERAVDER